MKGNFILEWAILITTVIQPFVSYWLETRRDKKFGKLREEIKKERRDFNAKLEEKEKRIENLEEKRLNYEKDKHLELRELIKKFKKLHIVNSRSIISPITYRRTGEELRSWDLNLDIEQKEEYNEKFFEQIEKEINKVNLPDDDNSFVLKDHPEANEFIKWKEYKEVLSKSAEPFEYFEKLSNLSGDSKKILFSANRMNSLFSKILS